MSERTIHEINEEFSSTGPGILNSYLESLNEIKAQREPEAGGYLDRLTGQQRRDLLRDQKMERALEITGSAREEYAAELERYHDELGKRVDYLKGRLFKVEDAGAGARAALATDTELGTLLEYAARSGNAELGRAVFVAAEQRGLGDLMASYFDRMDPEARELYQEWSEVPLQEILTRQKVSTETLLPDPDPERLMQPAQAMRA